MCNVDLVPSHLAVVKSNNGKSKFKPYLHRPQNLELIDVDFHENGNFTVLFFLWFC